MDSLVEAPKSGLTMSTVPPLIPRLPLGCKVPAMVRKSPFTSYPAVEKTYVPLKLLAAKAPVGGGVPLLELLPQPARKKRVERARSRMVALRTDITSPWRKLCQDRKSTRLNSSHV